jgi:signal transduction histidine kinase
VSCLPYVCQYCTLRTDKFPGEGAEGREAHRPSEHSEYWTGAISIDAGLAIMVKIINARTAGYRLAWIVAVLLIPIIYLGINIGTSLRADYTNIQSEIAGSDYINLLSPILLDAAVQDIKPNTKKLFERDSATYSAKLGLTKENERLSQLISAPNFDHDIAINQILKLHSRVGIASRIAYTSDPESYHLGVLITEDVPEAIADFDRLKDVVLNASTEVKNHDANQMILALGSLTSSMKRIQGSLESTVDVGTDRASYDELLNLSTSIKTEINHMAEIGMAMGPSSADGAADFVKTALIHKISNVNQRWMADFRFMSEKLRQKFDVLAQLRAGEIQSRTLSTLLMSIATVFLGLGSAIAMYRSTLRHLDQVEASKSVAENARIEAEQMSKQVSKINDDMVRVNGELATNMQLLKDAQDALVKKGRMEQMGQLTATIAHELRNPLGAVRTSAFLIERKIKGKELGIEPQITRINNGVTRCDNIITQLLDFSRSKKLSCRSENLDIWLEKVISEEASQLPASVAIDCLLGMKGIEVPFDPSRLQRAIINLVSNASEAMVGNGEDASRFTTATPCITITTKIDVGFAVIAIRDNGVGILPENLEKIREPLFTTKSFGTGLGLPAVDQIVVQHGGVLEISSDPGKGATFTIKLPLQSNVEQAA